MGLVSVTGLWRSQLLASRILCGHQGLPSATSSAIMGSTCSFLPSMLLVRCATNQFVSLGRVFFLIAMRLHWWISGRRMMLWWLGGRRHAIHQRDGSGCAVSSRLKLGSNLAGLECGSPMLFKLDRSNICLGLFLLGISLVAAPQCLLEALGKENGREV